MDFFQGGCCFEKLSTLERGLLLTRFEERLERRIGDKGNIALYIHKNESSLSIE
jgi:hypothetical protein